MSRFGRVIAATAAFVFIYIAFLYLTLPDVRDLRTKHFESTAFMNLRAREARAEGRELRRVHQWVPYNRISPHLKRAVLVAEDAGFWGHEGIDLVEIRKALQSGEGVTQMRGASTITQQLAKNLYLSPSRNPFRKLTELLITRRLEHELSKTRIFELYLNSIEWGDGIWGAEAAARTYFGIPASAVAPDQARADGRRHRQSARAEHRAGRMRAFAGVSASSARAWATSRRRRLSRGLRPRKQLCPRRRKWNPMRSRRRNRCLMLPIPSPTHPAHRAHPMHPHLSHPTSLLSGEEMTAQRAVLSQSGGRLAARSFHFTDFSYAVARAFKNVAVFTRLFAMTPSPTHRCIPSSPW